MSVHAKKETNKKQQLAHTHTHVKRTAKTAENKTTLAEAQWPERRKKKTGKINNSHYNDGSSNHGEKF